jgi:antitoxin YefM
MHTINFSDARSNLKAVLDRVVDDADVTIITRRDADDVVVMSLDSWNSWRETMYLMASPANARRLTESLAQARAGKARPRRLAESAAGAAPAVHETPAEYAVNPHAKKRAGSRTNKSQANKSRVSKRR